MTREDKLKQLKTQKTAKGMTIVTNGAPFVQALQDKIDDFKKALGNPIGVEATDLINELKNINAFVPAISELVKSINDINVDIIVENLDHVNAKFEEQLKTLKNIAEIKLPDVDVKVSAFAENHVKGFSATVEKLVEASKDSAELSEKSVKNIIKQFDNLIKSIRESTAKSQQLENFIPTRRVRKIGNSLVFDDDAWASTAGGGGGVQEIGATSLSTGQVSINNTATLVIAARNGRRGVLITNLSDVDIWIGEDGVTTANGSLLLGTRGTALFVPTQTALYAVTSSGTQSISYLEAF